MGTSVVFLKGQIMPLELKISLGDDGNMRIEGPVDDLIKAYGLLEMAKDALRVRAMVKSMEAQPKIAVPTMHVPDLSSPFRGR